VSDIGKIARENVEAYSSGNWEQLKASLSPDCVYDEIGTQRKMKGADELVQAYQAWKQAIPDGKGTIKDTLVSGNKVAQEVVWTGTQSGPLPSPSGTIPPSGKPISVPGAQVITFEGDKIVELKQYFNLMTLLQQIGAVSQ